MGAAAAQSKICAAAANTAWVRAEAEDRPSMSGAVAQGALGTSPAV